MKYLFCFLSFGFYTLSALAQVIHSPTFTTLSPLQKASAKEVTLTGKLSTNRNGDFRQLRDLAWQLYSLNLAEAQIDTIPANALFAQQSLTYLTLPKSLKSIGNNAFMENKSLCDTLFFPSSLSFIGERAFMGCKNIKQLIFNTEQLNHLLPFTFAHCLSLEGSLQLPLNLKEIHFGAFYNCPQIQEIILPYTLSYIEAQAFSQCKALQRIIIHTPTPPSIHPNAFDGIHTSHILLLVPQQSIKIYRNHPIWKLFKIKGQ